MRGTKLLDPETMKLKGKLSYYIDGTPLLKKTATDEQIEIFNKIKNRLKYDRMYNLFHYNWREYSLFKNKIYFYRIPKDIFPYITYKNDQIIVKDSIPEELKEKANICKKILEIDFNYFFFFLDVSCLNGKEIGINNQFKFKTPLIIFVKSKNKIEFGEDYSYVSERRYVKYSLNGRSSEKGIIYIGDNFIT